jgi:hypothetical protein
MQELRELARTPPINGFIADPPPIYSNGGVQGVNLEVDRYWLRCFRTEFGFWAEAAVPSFNYRIRKLLRDHRLDFSWKPPRWINIARVGALTKMPIRSLSWCC